MTKHTTLATFLFLAASELAVAAPAAPPQPKPDPEDPEGILTAEELRSCRMTRAGCWGVKANKVRIAKKLTAEVAAAFLLPEPKLDEEKPS